MQKSESIKAISKALSSALGEMTVVKMDAQNPFLKNKYATLGAVIETSRPVLAKYELAIIQSPVSAEEKIGITTLLTHSSGEWLEDTIFISTTENKGLSSAQNAGVVISYLRRYSLQAFLNMYADEDTDAHKPSETKERPITEQERKTKGMATFAELKKRADAVGVTIEAMSASLSADAMIEHYKTQLQFVKAAEAQKAAQ
jgi:hypothetical protein